MRSIVKHNHEQNLEHPKDTPPNVLFYVCKDREHLVKVGKHHDIDKYHREY